MTNYVEKIIAIKTEEDRDACFRFLTMANVSELCHKFYNAEYINSIIEYSDCLIYFSNPTNNIVAFSLVRFKSKKKGKILDILLACAITNKDCKMIAHSLYNFAVKYKYPFLYVSPRTPELRKTFIKYGFESIHGIEGVDEVLEKEIDLDIPIFYKRGKTLKVGKAETNSEE
jgi:hypothetical protein